MRRHLPAVLILITLSIEILSACSTNYLVDPIATPTFTAPWQGSVQLNATTHGKLYLEAAGSLPSNISFVATHESWGEGFSNDQRMNSLALGPFWRFDNTSLFALGGFGAGAQRIGPGYPALRGVYVTNTTLEGGSDFNRFFAEFEWVACDTVTTWLYGPSVPIPSSSIGLATRLEYLNRYRFWQTERGLSYDSSGTITDTAFTFDGQPKQTLSLGIAGFASAAVPYLQFVQLYTQLLFRIPLSGYTGYWDVFELTGGVRVAF